MQCTSISKCSIQNESSAALLVNKNEQWPDSVQTRILVPSGGELRWRVDKERLAQRGHDLAKDDERDRGRGAALEDEAAQNAAQCLHPGTWWRTNTRRRQ